MRDLSSSDVFKLADKKYPDKMIRLSPLPNKPVPKDYIHRGMDPFGHVFQLHIRKKRIDREDGYKDLDWTLECQGTLPEIERFLDAKTDS